MGRTGARMPSFCLNRIRPHVQIRSPPIQAKNVEKYAKEVEDDEEKDHTTSNMADEEKNTGDVTKPTPIVGRKIMIVVDSSLEAKNALQWALTHTVQSHDLLVLLYVTNKPSSNQDEDSKKEINPRIFEFLASMKNSCKLKRPEVQVEVAVAQGKEKGHVIVEEAKKQGVSLLVLGQKKRSMTWRLIMMWAGGRVVAGGGSGSGGVVEYCIQNASCMAIAVRRKGKKLGGYLITTKRQKDFWLLA